MVQHTINRKKKEKKVDKLPSQILDALKRSKNPISTQEIAELLKRPWHSVQTRCLRMQIDGRLSGFRVGRINLWSIKEL